MMLNIDGATIGSDSSGVKDALKNLKVAVIDDTKDILDKGVSTLEETINEIWVGTSADNYKENIRTDKDNVKTGLEEAYSRLETQLNDIVAKMEAADQEIVEKR